MSDYELNPLACGKWDGVNLWLQFAPVPEPGILHVRVKADSFEHIRTFEGMTGKTFLVMPLWVEWKKVTVDVSCGDEKWQRAKEIRFIQSSCDFEVKAFCEGQIKDGAIFSSLVDGVCCSYRALEARDYRAGEVFRIKLLSVQASGYNQIDHEGDFHAFFDPPGLEIRNIGPSYDHYMETGEDAFIICKDEVKSPFTFVIHKGER